MLFAQCWHGAGLSCNCSRPYRHLPRVQLHLPPPYLLGVFIELFVAHRKLLLNQNVALNNCHGGNTWKLVPRGVEVWFFLISITKVTFIFVHLFMEGKIQYCLFCLCFQWCNILPRGQSCKCFSLAEIYARLEQSIHLGLTRPIFH